MAEFLRPAARTALWRWRGVALAGVVLALGLWGSFTTFGFVRWLAVALATLGTALVMMAVQRLRFGHRDGGPGIVTVDERRLSYFGPLTGGIIDIDDIWRLDLDGSGHPPHWVLHGPGGQMVTIPITAQGADALFDAFAALPGLSAETLIGAVNAPQRGAQTLWETPKARLVRG